VPIQPAIYICSKCDQGLPAWEQLILGIAGVAIAFGLLAGALRLSTLIAQRWKGEPPR
jgi:predicted branched-subunit amino acid permease